MVAEMKPFSQACENNKDPILGIIAPLLQDRSALLEIASGTGQHACYFAGRLPHLLWQTSDLAENHAGIRAWLADAPANALAPLLLDVNSTDWGLQHSPVADTQGQVPAIFTANSLHIMAWSAVQNFFRGVAKVLQSQGLLMIYGPFNYAGGYTSDSNARFDQWLKERDPRSAIRDFEAVNELAALAGLSLTADHSMPANNRLLVWQRLS